MSNENTFEALKKRLHQRALGVRGKPIGGRFEADAIEQCADELAALAPHYIHKDRLRELLSKLPGIDVYFDDAYAIVEFEHGGEYIKRADALTALLGGEGT